MDKVVPPASVSKQIVMPSVVPPVHSVYRVYVSPIHAPHRHVPKAKSVAKAAVKHPVPLSPALQDNPVQPDNVSKTHAPM